MSGTAKVKPPKNDEEWARNTQRRIEQVENPSSTRIGAWVLSTDPESGNLIASNVNGGAVVLANQPEGDAEADAVSSGWSHVKVSRQAVQTATAGNHTSVVWDTVDSQSDDWSVGAGSSTLVIPESGLWMVVYNLILNTASNVAVTSRVYIDGAVRMSNRTSGGGVEPTLYSTDLFTLNAGTELYATSWLNGASGSYTFGPSGTTPSTVTSMSLTRIPIG